MAGCNTLVFAGILVAALLGDLDPAVYYYCFVYALTKTLGIGFYWIPNVIIEPLLIVY